MKIVVGRMDCPGCELTAQIIKEQEGEEPILIQLDNPDYDPAIKKFFGDLLVNQIKRPAIPLVLEVTDIHMDTLGDYYDLPQL